MATKTNLELAVEALERHIGAAYSCPPGPGSSSNVERDFDRGDFLPAEQLCTANADRAVIATNDTAKFHAGEGR